MRSRPVPKLAQDGRRVVAERPHGATPLALDEVSHPERDEGGAVFMARGPSDDVARCDLPERIPDPTGPGPANVRRSLNRHPDHGQLERVEFVGVAATRASSTSPSLAKRRASPRCAVVARLPRLAELGGGFGPKFGERSFGAFCVFGDLDSLVGSAPRTREAISSARARTP